MLPRPKSQKNEPAGSPGIYSAGKATKKSLLKATLRIIAHKGFAAVTHRAVAAEAKAALRTTTYYFQTKQDLIREAFRYFNEQELQRLEEVNSHYTDLKNRTIEESLDAVVEVVEMELKDANFIVAAEFELVLAIAREPSYAPEYDQIQQILHQRSTARMKALGAKNPEQLARMSLALIRGYQFLFLAQPNKPLDLANFRSDLLALVKNHLS
jgi:DNA-binding transcriptional regulator YbjK